MTELNINRFAEKLAELAEERQKRRSSHLFFKGFIFALFVISYLFVPSSYSYWEDHDENLEKITNELAELHIDKRNELAKLHVDKDIEIGVLLAEIDRLTVFETQVVATMYKPHRYYTDDSPDILADGTKINIHKVEHLRYVALSRNLLDRWGGPFHYGDFIVVTGADDRHNGVWQVKDTMNKRWVDRIDFLVPLGTKNFKYDSVTIKRQFPKGIASL